MLCTKLRHTIHHPLQSKRERENNKKKAIRLHIVSVLWRDLCGSLNLRSCHEAGSLLENDQQLTNLVAIAFGDLINDDSNDLFLCPR